MEGKSTGCFILTQSNQVGGLSKPTGRQAKAAVSSNAAQQTGQGGYVRVTRSGMGSLALLVHRALLRLNLP